MEPRSEVSRLEREAQRLGRELIIIVDRSHSAGQYIALGSVSREFEQLSPAELETLKASHDALLVVSVEPPSSPG